MISFLAFVEFPNFDDVKSKSSNNFIKSSSDSVPIVLCSILFKMRSKSSIIKNCIASSLSLVSISTRLLPLLAILVNSSDGFKKVT